MDLLWQSIPTGVPVCQLIMQYNKYDKRFRTVSCTVIVVWNWLHWILVYIAVVERSNTKPLNCFYSCRHTWIICSLVCSYLCLLSTICHSNKVHLCVAVPMANDIIICSCFLWNPKLDSWVSEYMLLWLNVLQYNLVNIEIFYQNFQVNL